LHMEPAVGFPLVWRDHDQQRGRQHEHLGGTGHQHWTARTSNISRRSWDVSRAFVTPVTGLSGGILTGNDRSPVADNTFCALG